MEAGDYPKQIEFRLLCPGGRLEGLGRQITAMIEEQRGVSMPKEALKDPVVVAQQMPIGAEQIWVPIVLNIISAAAWELVFKPVLKRLADEFPFDDDSFYD